jgi:hypothetical protein
MQGKLGILAKMAAALYRITYELPPQQQAVSKRRSELVQERLMKCIAGVLPYG